MQHTTPRGAAVSPRAISAGDLVVPARILGEPQLCGVPQAKLVWAALWQLAGYRSGTVRVAPEALAAMVGMSARSLRPVPRKRGVAPTPGIIDRLAELGAVEVIDRGPMLALHVADPNLLGDVRRAFEPDPQLLLPELADDEASAEAIAEVDDSPPTISLASMTNAARAPCARSVPDDGGSEGTARAHCAHTVPDGANADAAALKEILESQRREAARVARETSPPAAKPFDTLARNFLERSYVPNVPNHQQRNDVPSGNVPAGNVEKVSDQGGALSAAKEFRRERFDRECRELERQLGNPAPYRWKLFSFVFVLMDGPLNESQFRSIMESVVKNQPGTRWGYAHEALMKQLAESGPEACQRAGLWHDGKPALHRFADLKRRAKLLGIDWRPEWTGGKPRQAKADRH